MAAKSKNSSTATIKTPLGKDELASLKRDLARAYKLIDRIRPLAVSRKETALYNGVLIVAVWLVKKYKIEV